MNDAMKAVTNVGVKIADNIVNFASKIGTSKGKAFHNQITYTPSNAYTLESAWRGDWITRKCVEMIPADMLREWRVWEIEEEEQAKIDKIEKRLGIKKAIKQALIFERVFGGAAIFLGTGAEHPSQPLDINSIKKDGLKYIRVFHRHELVSTEGHYNRDVSDENYRRPEMFTLTAHGDSGAMVEIHRSRLVIFDGLPVTDDTREANDGWGDPVLDTILETIKTALSAHAGLAEIIQEAKVDVIKVKNLAELTSTEEGQKKLFNRFTAANQMKSIVNAILLDDQEDFQTKTASFAGLKDTMMQFFEVVAAAVDVPLTRFLGQSPGGLNSAGSGELKNYYDNIRALQTNDLGPALELLDEAMLRSAGVVGKNKDGAAIDVSDLTYKWVSLFQPTAKEQAEIGKINAETVNIYAQTQLVPVFALAEGVQNLLIASETLPGMKQAYAEIDETEFENQLNSIIESAENEEVSPKPVIEETEE